MITAFSLIRNQTSAEELLNLLQVALSDQHFVNDYQRLYPVTDDIDIVIQIAPHL